MAELSGETNRDVPAMAPPNGALSSQHELDFVQRCMELRLTLLSYLRGILPDHYATEDCLQETFSVLWEKYSETEGEDFRKVAFTCARHKALQWLDRNKVTRLMVVDPAIAQKIAEAAVQSADAFSADVRDHRAEWLRACLKQLAPEQRKLLEARYGADSKGGLLELAKELGRKADALYKQLERLRDVLKSCVERKSRSEDS